MRSSKAERKSRLSALATKWLERYSTAPFVVRHERLTQLLMDVEFNAVRKKRLIKPKPRVNE